MAKSRRSRSADRDRNRGQEEPNRVLGFPVPARTPRAPDNGQQAASAGPKAVPDAEPQRALGIPVDWFSTAGEDVRRSLARSARILRRRDRS